ncbi:MAG: acyl carrier protein [Desulfuromonadales bacterium]|nr:acyl carrier protein [Desulfuromonadales bacterium]
MSKDSIRYFIATELAADGARTTIDDNDQLLEQGIIDSFGIMTLLGFLEEKFSVRIEGDDLTPENFSSISTISSLIDRKAGLSAGA